jgi:hypothetical protein
MATVTLQWRDRNAGGAQEDGFRVYRATAAIDLGALPAPLATLAADTTQYDDTTAAAATTYYYVVSTYRGALTEFLVFDPFTTAA